jgi:dTMP kinase
VEEPMKKKGLLVTLEGIDNAGKTSHITRLAEYFQRMGKSVVITKELTSPIGPFIWDGLYAKSLSPFLKAYLFATDRAIRYERFVLPALESGSIVLADRWNVSAYVYRGLEGFDVEFVKALNSKIPPADLTIILDLPVEISMQRGVEAKKPCPYTPAQLEEARRRYVAYGHETGSPILDATMSSGQVFESLRDSILKMLNETGG